MKKLFLKFAFLSGTAIFAVTLFLVAGSPAAFAQYNGNYGQSSMPYQAGYNNSYYPNNYNSYSNPNSNSYIPWNSSYWNNYYNYPYNNTYQAMPYYSNSYPSYNTGSSGMIVYNPPCNNNLGYRNSSYHPQQNYYNHQSRMQPYRPY